MKSIILMKQSGQLIPQDHLLRVLHEVAPNCFGVALFTKGDTILQLNHWPAMQDIGGNMTEIANAVGELCEAHKEDQMLWSFSDNPGKVTSDANGWDTPHMQPYPLLYDGDGGVHLALVAQGDFSAWEQDGDIPSLVHAIVDDLDPRLKELLEESEGDVTKLMARLRKSQSFQRDLKKLSTGDNGVFTLFASDGDMFTVSANDKSIVQADWGWTTHKVEAAPAVVQKGKLSLKDKAVGLFKPKAEGAPAPAPVTDVPKVDPTVPVPDQKVETAPAPAPVTTETVSPDPAEWGRLSNKEKKNWYLRKAGWCPDNWRQRPKVDIRLPIKDLKDLNKVAAIQNGSASEIKQKDTAPHAVKSEHAKPVASKTPWLIPVEVREKMMKDGVILQMLGRSSEIINSIEKIKEEEKKFTSFSEQMPKLGLDALLAATAADMEKIAFEFPESVPAILLSYRSAYLKLKELEKTVQLEQAAKEAAPAPKPKLTVGRAA